MSGRGLGNMEIFARACLDRLMPGSKLSLRQIAAAFAQSLALAKVRLSYQPSFMRLGVQEREGCASTAVPSGTASFAEWRESLSGSGASHASAVSKSSSTGVKDLRGLDILITRVHFGTLRPFKWFTSAHEVFNTAEACDAGEAAPRRKVR